MELIDLSHTVTEGMTTYPRLPGPVITEYLTFADSHDRYEPGTEFAIGRIDMVANTGTYLDTPAHRYPEGHDLSALPLHRCAMVPGVVVDGGEAIGPEAFDGVDVHDRAVLLRTGWDRHWGTEAYGDPGHPFLTEDGAHFLTGAGARLVGIDSVNIDHIGVGTRPAHTVLLAAGIPVVEHLTGLSALPTEGFTFTAVPPAVRGMATFPVRAFAAVG